MVSTGLLKVSKRVALALRIDEVQNRDRDSMALAQHQTLAGTAKDDGAIAYRRSRQGSAFPGTSLGTRDGERLH
jgi:hypothetical protein